MDPRTVLLVQSVRGYPSVSVLLPTRPGPRLAPDDVAHLDRLVADACRRLDAEPSSVDVEPVLARLEELRGEVTARPARRGLALFAGPSFQAAIDLSVPVEERVAVDWTFLTRDLVRALHQAPRYRLLVLSSDAVSLYEGTGRRLVEVREHPSPMTVAQPDPGGRGARGGDPGRQAAERRFALYREADAVLTARTRGEPLPLVLAGTTRHTVDYRRLSGAPGGTVGVLSGSHGRTPPWKLGRAAETLFADARATRTRDALAELRAATARRTASGLARVWATVLERRVSLLVVEESYVQPARLTDDGRTLVVTGDPEPDVLDDVVDEVIELVLLTGGEVVLAPDGALDAWGRIAAVVRPGRVGVPPGLRVPHPAAATLPHPAAPPAAPPVPRSPLAPAGG